MNNKLQPSLTITGTPMFTGGWEIAALASPFASEYLTLTNTITLTVSSDPTNADPDGDGIPDDAEKRLYELYQFDPNRQPYHPLVANVNPLQLYASASVPPNGYLRPGESFVYTNTLISYADMDPGVLEVTLPSVLGGGTALTQVQVSPHATQTVAGVYQVNVAAGSQPFAINSSARARLAARNATTEYGFAVNEQGNRGQSSVPYYARAVSGDNNRPDRPDSYLLSGLLSQSFNRGGKGDIVAYDLGGPATPLDDDSVSEFLNVPAPLEDLAFRRGIAAPGTACNDAGDCFVVWDQVDNCNRVTVNRITVRQALSDRPIDSELEPVLQFRPDAASLDNASTLWSADALGLHLAAGQSTTQGLPVTRTFCDPSQPPYITQAAISIYDSDGGVLWPIGMPNQIVLAPPSMVSMTFNAGNVAQDLIDIDFSVEQKQRNIIVGSSVGRAGNGLLDPLGSSGMNVGDFNPVVASDGDGFLVAWNRKVATYSDPNWTIQSKIMVRRFYSYGVAKGPSQEVWSKPQPYTVEGSGDIDIWGFINYDAAFAHTETDLIPNVIWAGDRYRVVWALPATPLSTLLFRDIYANDSGSVGVLVAGLPANQHDRRNLPALAYDPINHRILTVYHSSDDAVAGLLSDLVSATSTVIPSLAQKQPGTVPKTAVAHYPGIQGWLLAFDWDTQYKSYVALKADGSSLRTAPLQTWPAPQTLQPSGRSLICPSPSSAPVVALPFEEMPNATTFVDSSGHSANAACSGDSCPLAGVAGVGVLNAPVASSDARPPRTDRALRFDGVNDSVTFTAPVVDGFTYSFWFKPDPAQIHVGEKWWEGTPLLLANGANFESLYGVAIGAGNRILAGQGSQSASSQPVATDQWHHVVLTRRAHNRFTFNDTLFFYLDGQLITGVAGLKNNTLPVSTPQVQLGKFNERYYRGDMDFLTVYDTDLQADAVVSLYRGELQSDLGYSLNPSYCVLAGAAAAASGDSGFPWTKIAITRTLARGEGPLPAQDSLYLNVDAVAPTSTIDSFAAVSYIKAAPVTQAGLATATMIIGGSATDADSGVNHVSVIVDLDEPTGEVWFDDATVGSNAAYCEDLAHCPTAGEIGRRDGAVRFDGQSALTVAHSSAIDFDENENFTLMAWIKATGGNYPILVLKYGVEGSYSLGLDEIGQVYLALNGVEILKSSGGIYNATWVHVAVSIDRTGERILYLNGVESDYDPGNSFTASVANTANMNIGYGLEGLMDDVMIFNRSLKGLEIQAIMAMADQVWYAATYAQDAGGPNAAGEIGADWSLAIPAGMEGHFQLDLRATDSTQKRFRRANLWRGVIDNLAPRITLEAATTGVTYLDPATGAPRYDVNFTAISAIDQNLDLASFTGACSATTQPTRSYVSEPWLDQLFPDLTLRDKLSFQCHAWAAQPNPVVEATACDIFGNCATASKIVSTDSVARAADNTVAPVLVWPPSGSTIAMGASVQLQMAAAGGKPLKEIGVLVNGQAAEKVTFNQQEGVTRTVAAVTFNLPAAGEGGYGLSVRTTAWDGTVSEGPVANITLDTAEPTGSLITAVVSEADAFTPESGLMRFTGTAGDSLGNGNVATVQISVDGGPFQDATWHGDGTWATVTYVGANPYGKNIPVTMRTIDKAGRVMTDAKQVLVDIRPPPGFDVALIPTLAVGDITVNEDAGTANFVISISAIQGYGTVAVNYATVAGSALAEDYTTVAGVAIIRAGESSVVVSVPILDNTLQEPAETFALMLSAPVNATVADGQGVATIVDNDAGAPPTATPTPTATATAVGAPPTDTPTPTATATIEGAPPTDTPTSTPIPAATMEGAPGMEVYLPLIMR